MPHKRLIFREVEAVESEFQLQQTSDTARLEQVLAEQAGVNHPMSHFCWGNLKSLREIPKEQGINIRDALVDFYNSELKHFRHLAISVLPVLLTNRLRADL